MSKKITGIRPCDERKEVAEKLGWKFTENEIKDDRLFKNGYDVCMRSMGRFFVYKDRECVGSERSFDLDGTDWYEEVLDIIYFREEK